MPAPHYYSRPAAPHYSRPADEQDWTKTAQRKIRRQLQEALSASGEAQAGRLESVLAVAREITQLVNFTSNGRYGLAVVRQTFDDETAQTRLQEQYVYGRSPDPIGSIKYTGIERNTSSLIHEPVVETLRREKHLRKQLTADS